MLGMSAIAQTALADIPLLPAPPPFVTPGFIAGGGGVGGGGFQDPRKRIAAADARAQPKLSIEQIEAQEANNIVTQRHDAAVRLGRLGGQKGGPARAEKLSDRQRSSAARHAARTRWK